MHFAFQNVTINLKETLFLGGIFMQHFIQKYKSYFEPKSIQLIEKCLILSILTCLFAIFLLYFYNLYYISINLYKASIIIYRTGLMIGLFPIAFALVIGKWKKEHN